MVTANQVVRETPKVEVPVIFICLFPWVANWALTIVNSVMGAAGTSAEKLGSDLLHSKGVYYDGLMHLGSGAPLASMLWGCIAIFAIMNKPLRLGDSCILWSTIIAVWRDSLPSGWLCGRQLDCVCCGLPDDACYVCPQACY
ncbi:conserved protein of unknown function (plasmid) [Escherichia coli]|nr:conserved protein of unknown function [Escherichia coli]